VILLSGRSARDHAGCDRVVRRLVGEDERAGDPVLLIGVDHERAREPEPDGGDVVELETVCGIARRAPGLIGLSLIQHTVAVMLRAQTG